MLINKTLWRFFATATIFFWISLSAHAQLLMQPNISVAQAQKIIETIITECSIPGDLVTVTIAVVDDRRSRRCSAAIHSACDSCG